MAIDRSALIDRELVKRFVREARGINFEGKDRELGKFMHMAAGRIRYVFSLGDDKDAALSSLPELDREKFDALGKEQIDVLVRLMDGVIQHFFLVKEPRCEQGRAIDAFAGYYALLSTESKEGQIARRAVEQVFEWFGLGEIPELSIDALRAQQGSEKDGFGRGS